MSIKVIGILILCAGLLLEIAQVGSDFWLGSSIAVVGVLLYAWGRFHKSGPG